MTAPASRHGPGILSWGRARLEGVGTLPVVGVDGCKRGWVCVGKDLRTGESFSRVQLSIERLLASIPGPAVLAIDIPIGLTDAGPRECDRMARKLLGRPRASSVFPAPVRPALHASSRVEASEINRSVDGRGVGAQAWNLYPRIRQVDRLVTADPLARRFIFEVHPEVSFMAWNGGEPVRESKMTHDGLRLRRELVLAHFGDAVLASVRSKHPPAAAGDDDILDAFACLWTAERIVSGDAVALPSPPLVDSQGIEMAIWY